MELFRCFSRAMFVEACTDPLQFPDLRVALGSFSLPRVPSAADLCGSWDCTALATIQFLSGLAKRNAQEGADGDGRRP